MSELESIVQWLEGKDETQWADHIALGEECLTNMRQSAKQFKDPSKSKTRSAQLRVDNQNAAKLNRAIMHVEAMLKAMYARQGRKALASGRAALAEL